MFQRFVNLLQRLWARLSWTGGIHYLNGGPGLPPPLTPEEEKALLARMADGDPAARDELITHNLRLVVYLAKKYEGSGVPSEDMVSIGTIGLIKAVNTFTPERSIKLATYASRCIGNEILMYLRKSSNRRQEASIDEPLNIDGDGNELLLSDVLSSEADQVGQRLEQDAERASLRRSVEQLSPRERQIMGAALRPAGRRGADPEGGGRRHRHQPELYFEAGEEDHTAAEGAAGGVTL